MKILQVTSSDSTDSFQSGPQLELHVLYVVTIFVAVVELVEAVGVCRIVKGTQVDMATWLMARNVMKCVE